jgi:hypothetical protein
MNRSAQRLNIGTTNIIPHTDVAEHGMVLFSTTEDDTKPPQSECPASILRLEKQIGPQADKFNRRQGSQLYKDP